MLLLSYIDLKWFLISLFVGFLIVYTTAPKPTVVVKYPTPENSKDQVFKDDVENCYKFKTEEVTCPAGKKVEDLPIQKNLEYFNLN